jgi:hypothetical protein
MVEDWEYGIETAFRVVDERVTAHGEPEDGDDGKGGDGLRRGTFSSSFSFCSLLPGGRMEVNFYSSFWAAFFFAAAAASRFFLMSAS